MSGRTTFAVAVWAAAWVVLHRRWAGREVASDKVWWLTLVLIALGVLAAFPPLWAML